MTQREWLLGLALQGLLANPKVIRGLPADDEADAPQFSCKADYIHEIERLKKRLIEQSRRR